MTSTCFSSVSGKMIHMTSLPSKCALLQISAYQTGQIKIICRL